MVNWSCCSALCFNNFKTLDKNGLLIKYYNLPRNAEIQKQYKKILNTTGINWKKGVGYICAAHWSMGERTSISDLPDVAVPTEQYEIIKLKFKRAKYAVKKSKTPTPTQRQRLRKAKHRLATAQRIINTKNTSANKSIRRSHRKRVVIPEVEAPIEKKELEKSQVLNPEVKATA